MTLTTSFFGSCDDPPCRHRHHAWTEQTGWALDDEDAPHSKGAIMTTTTPPCHRTRHEKETTKKTTPTRSMDESHHRPKRAIAEAVAHPLGIQPSINRHCRLLLRTGQLLGYSYKATPSTWCSGTRKWCCSSRIGGGRLLKTAQEASWAGTKWLLAPPH